MNVLAIILIIGIVASYLLISNAILIIQKILKDDNFTINKVVCILSLATLWCIIAIFGI